MKFFIYECRHGDEKILVEHTRAGWDWILNKMEYCNGATVEEIRDSGCYVEGSYEQGRLRIDDGGQIETIELQEI